MTANEVAFIKVLRNQNYTQKQVRIIMKLGKSTVSRIFNNLTYRHIKMEEYVRDRRLENKKVIFDIISECKEIPGIGALSEQDKQYIKLLKYCDVPYKKVRTLYYDVPTKYFRPVWDYNNYDIKYSEFDSELIGIDKEDFKDFLE